MRRKQHYQLLFWVTILLGIVVRDGSCATGPDCPTLSTSNQERLAKYVTAKFEIAPPMQLVLKSTLPVTDDCYRKLVFAGQGPLGEISIVLYSSPDLRILSREFMDTTLDPSKERYEKARVAMGQLDGPDAPRWGDRDAPLTLVVFSDFECPFCKRAADVIRSEPLVREKKVRVVFRNYPLPQHPWAQKAAELASCAEFQSPELFWKVHDLIFERQERINPNDADSQLLSIVTQVPGVNQAQMDDCVKKQLSLGIVLRDKALGSHMGVTATPTTFVNGETVQFDSGAALHRLLLNYLSDTTTASSRTTASVAMF
jgi:protein-disulfide isomerase